MCVALGQSPVDSRVGRTELEDPTEVCHDVRVEPELQPINGESMSNATANTSQGAHLDSDDDSCEWLLGWPF